jgi:hypothetical protein
MTKKATATVAISLMGISVRTSPTETRVQAIRCPLAASGWNFKRVIEPIEKRAALKPKPLFRVDEKTFGVEHAVTRKFHSKFAFSDHVASRFSGIINPNIPDC